MELIGCSSYWICGLAGRVGWGSRRLVSQRRVGGLLCFGWTMKPGRICGVGGFLGLGPWLREREREMCGVRRGGGGRERERGGADLDFFREGGGKREREREG